MKHFRNFNWSATTESHHLMEAFIGDLRDAGWQYFDITNTRNIKQNMEEGYIHITPNNGVKNDDRIVLVQTPETKNFDLEIQYRAALNYATQKQEEDYEDGDWVWVKRFITDKAFNDYGLIKYTKDSDYTYGFNYGAKWTNKFYFGKKSNSVIKRRATKKEVETFLWLEWQIRCEQKGINDYQQAEIECHADGNSCDTANERDYDVQFDLGVNELWNKNGLIFFDGFWAEPKCEMITVYKRDLEAVINSLEENFSASNLLYECEIYRAKMETNANFLKALKNNSLRDE